MCGTFSNSFLWHIFKAAQESKQGVMIAELLKARLDGLPGFMHDVIKALHLKCSLESEKGLSANSLSNTLFCLRKRLPGFTFNFSLNTYLFSKFPGINHNFLKSLFYISRSPVAEVFKSRQSCCHVYGFSLKLLAHNIYLEA